MYTLYMATTNGISWEVPAEHLGSVGMIYFLLFLVYVAFFLFVICNTLTSLFVEATIVNANKDEKMVIQLELERKQEYVKRLQIFFDTIDDDASGEVTFEEFEKHVDDPNMVAFASSLEIEMDDAKQFFRILSA